MEVKVVVIAFPFSLGWWGVTNYNLTWWVLSYPVFFFFFFFGVNFAEKIIYFLVTGDI